MDERREGVHLRAVPEAVINHLRHLRRDPVAEVDEVAIEGELFDEPVGLVEERHARRLVNAAALHADKSVLDDVRPAHAVAAADRVEFEDDLVGRKRLTVDLRRHPRLEVDPHRLRLLGGSLRRDRHPELDQLEAVGRHLLEEARLVAGVEAVLIGAVGLSLRGLHRDVALVAEIDELGAAGEALAELADPPRREDGDLRIERLGGELEAALVVPLAGGTVGEHRGPLAVGDVDDHLRNQWTGDRRAEEVGPLVAGLPLKDREGEVATEFLADVDDLGVDGAAGAGLLERRRPVLARLAEVDVDGDHVIAALDEPAEDHGGVEPPRIRQHALGPLSAHEDPSLDGGSIRRRPVSGRSEIGISPPGREPEGRQTSLTRAILWPPVPKPTPATKTILSPFVSRPPARPQAVTWAKRASTSVETVPASGVTPQ